MKLYKKIITWERKPNYSEIFVTLFCIALLLGVISSLCRVNFSVTFLTMIMTWGMYMSFKNLKKFYGKGKKIYYRKVNFI